MPLEEEEIRTFAGSAYFSRGVSYFRQGLVSSVRAIPNGIAARVKGSHWYEVEIALRPGSKPQYFCSCPLGVDGEFCKHCVAVSLAWLHQPAIADPKAKPKKSAAEAARLGFEKAVQARGRTGFITFYEVRPWVLKVRRAATRIGDLVAVGTEVAEVPGICEWALEQLDLALEQVDDEDDITIDLETQLFQIHCQACKAIRPDPIELAGRLLNLQKKFQYGAFHELFPAYSALLGEAGVAEYRRLLEAEVGMAKPHDRDYFERLFETLERHFGGFDGLSKRLTKDLRSLRHYLPVIELYRDAGRIQEAAEWADRGFKAYRDEYDSEVVKAAVSLYHQLGRGTDAVQLIWNCFYARPYVERYLDLKKHAEAASVWPEWRVRALLEIRMRIDQASMDKMEVDHSLLVEIFLFENDVEAAWLEAKQGGCEPRLWVQLARARGKDHPEESGLTLLEQGERAVREARNSRHEDAIALLIESAALMQKAGKSLDFADRIKALRNEFKHKRAFIQSTDFRRRQLLF